MEHAFLTGMFAMSGFLFLLWLTISEARNGKVWLACVNAFAIGVYLFAMILLYLAFALEGGV